MSRSNQISSAPVDRQNTLHLATAADRARAPRLEFVQVLSRRCSSFCAEAAVLVLVFGLLDYFMMKGHIELGWIAGALLISLALLALSITIELSALRWIKAHP